MSANDAVVVHCTRCPEHVSKERKVVHGDGMKQTVCVDCITNTQQKK